MSEPLTFDDLSKANALRCGDVFHAVDAWGPEKWAMATAGEAGELTVALLGLLVSGKVGTMCNATKKLIRHYEGTNTAKDPQTEGEAIRDIAMELADIIIYADLLATRLGIGLGDAVVMKFNEVSKRMRSMVEL